LNLHEFISYKFIIPLSCPDNAKEVPNKLIILFHCLFILLFSSYFIYYLQVPVILS